MNLIPVVLAVLAVLAALNLLSFSLMAADKRRARAGRWRISEKTLFLATACFGGLGGVLGTKMFHHKTKHWYFKVFFPVLLIVQIGIIVYLFAAGMPGSV